MAQVILQSSRSQNSLKSIGTGWNGAGLQTLPRSSNPPTIKYTKIILAKRNYAFSTTNNNNEQLISRKSPQMVTESLSRVTTSDDLEIEDAIKKNIIERKMLSIPEIDLTSPTKIQPENEPSHVLPSPGLNWTNE